MSKVAIITGASSGIGAAAAAAFNRQGYKVVLAGRDEARLASAATNLNDDAVIWAGDLTSSEACNALVRSAITRFGRVDVLLNCAGVIYRYAAEDTTDSQWDNTMAVNLTAPFFLSRAVIPHMKTSGGVILNISSDWGLRGGDLAVAYCASKGGLVLMTKAMAVDHAKDNIRVNAICPGDVDTPMLKGESEQLGIEYKAAMIENNAASPTGRITKPEEVAALCLFLASDAAEQITGAAIPIDGGASA